MHDDSTFIVAIYVAVILPIKSAKRRLASIEPAVSKAVASALASKLDDLWRLLESAPEEGGLLHP
jgi:hypothetical protein